MPRPGTGPPLFLAQKFRPPRAACHVHTARSAKTAFSRAPAQNTRTPEYHISQNGILGFSPKNATASPGPGALRSDERLHRHRIPAAPEPAAEVTTRIGRDERVLARPPGVPDALGLLPGSRRARTPAGCRRCRPGPRTSRMALVDLAASRPCRPVRPLSPARSVRAKRKPRRFPGGASRSRTVKPSNDRA
jgi:hypothetical protein